MAKEEAQKSKKPQNTGNKNMLIAAAAVVIVLAAAYVYFGNGTAPPPAPQQPGQKASPLESASAKLLLSSFDKGAALGQYYLNYTTNENGAETNYAIASDGTNSWVKEAADFGSREGFFGKDNLTYVLCLNYGGAALCALSGNDSNMAGIAADLRSLLPGKEAYLKQEEALRKHIEAGAITFAGEPVSEKVGQFDTKKVTYALNYRALTVQQLISIGVAPNDPGITALTDQKITYWVDATSGLPVRTLAEWKENLLANTYQTIYHSISIGAPKLPEQPGGLVETKAFLRFYSESVSDYQAKLSCLSKPQPERDACFKTTAVERKEWDLCKRITDNRTYEECTVIVAQERQDRTLCEKVTALRDDCYIAIASRTGNFGLCKLLVNAGLGGNCTQAAAEGNRLLEEKEAARQKLLASANCKASTDCKIAGNANQYCVPLNVSGNLLTNETSPLFACLKGVPCSCLEGFCGFAKDDPYYACTNRIEDNELQQYIGELTQNKSAG